MSWIKPGSVADLDERLTVGDKIINVSTFEDSFGTITVDLKIDFETLQQSSQPFSLGSTLVWFARTVSITDQFLIRFNILRTL